MSELLDVSSARTIGELGDVGPLSIGCWRLTGSDAENIAVISAAVDAGTALPGINDAMTGSAPDLGAYERGLAAPHYGPRN